jgi:hypothetical protein
VNGVALTASYDVVITALALEEGVIRFSFLQKNLVFDYCAPMQDINKGV